MKITHRLIESFVKKPDPTARVILVYGPNSGLMRERARMMALSIVTDINDPFNVAALSSDTLIQDPARLMDEAMAISMMGGDRLIRIEDLGDKLTALIKAYLENPSPHTLVVLEAGELGPSSSLRKLCEKADNAAALPCYVEDERDLARLIRQALQEGGCAADADAIEFLAANIGGDRAKARGEIEKLILYAGKEKISLESARASCGDAGAGDLDGLVYNTAGRQAAQALVSYSRLMTEGVNFIVIVRALQNHFRRLHFTRARIDGGMPAHEAVKGLRPPVFFKQEDEFKNQVGRWSLPALERVMTRLMDLEAQCKQTGMPAETLCAQAILAIGAARG